MHQAPGIPSRPCREDPKSHEMAVGGSTSSQPRVGSRRGWPHLPQVLQVLQSTFRLPRCQDAGLVYEEGASLLAFLKHPPPLTCNLGQVYRLLSVTAWQKVSPVSVCGERLMFTQSNMDNFNFGIDEHKRTVLMDFSEIGMLPETCIASTLSSDNNLSPIATSLSLSDNSNLASMAVITHCLGMVSDPKLSKSTCA